MAVDFRLANAEHSPLEGLNQGLQQGMSMGFERQKIAFAQQQAAQAQAQAQAELELKKQEQEQQKFKGALDILTNPKMKKSLGKNTSIALFKAVIPGLKTNYGIDINPDDVSHSGDTEDGPMDHLLNLVATGAPKDVILHQYQQDVLKSDPEDLPILKAFGDTIQTDKGMSPELMYRMQKDAEDKAAKAQEKEQALAVPGFRRTGKVEVKPEEAEKLRTAVGSFDSFTGGISKLRKLVNENGSTILTGKKSGEVESLVSALQIDYKNIAGLGVLSKSDEKFLNAVVFNPSNLSSLFTKKGTALAQLDQSLETAKKRLHTNAAAKGYEPEDIIEDGYRFKGGDKSDPANWEKL